MDKNVDLMHRPMMIGGEFTAADGAEWVESIDPATEELIGYVPAGGASDIHRAVEAAEAAFPKWANLDVGERSDYLRRLAQAIAKRGDEVLDIEVRDTGNTISRMRHDVHTAGTKLEYFAGLGLEMKGQTIPASAKNFHFTLREPYGVVGRIVPFNHPMRSAVAALSAPLMAGNTVVVKPPEQSPLSATILGEIVREILPPGVANIVTGYGAVAGDALVRHPTVRRLAFTGSVPTALAIQRAAAESCVKQISLELGGKNPLIAFPDVDPDVVAANAVSGMNFAWQGQSCGSTSRLLLHESLYEPVLKRIVERVSALKIGSPLDPTSEMGPINSKRHYDKVCSMIKAGISDGAELMCGGKRPVGEEFERGYWLEPTIFAGVEGGMRIAQQEIFGPVLSVFKWREEEDAFKLANSTEYGLTASILTNDLKTAFRAARTIKAGYIWINGVSTHFRGTSFGGVKNSGNGREEGLDELLSYTETKTVHFVL